MKAKRRGAKWLVLAASGSCYLAALPCPALLFTLDPPVRGITTLLWGWWGLVTGDFPWLANPMYFVALLLVALSSNKMALLLCAVAIGIGARSLLVEQWYFNEAQGTPVTGLGLAFYLWMASFVVLFLGAIILQWLCKPLKTESGPQPPPTLKCLQAENGQC